jgi:hypothetical protein
MAVTKASASGLAGSKFKDASAGTEKIAALPDAPTVGTATRSGSNISVPFTLATRGGTPVSFTVTSSPGSLTGSGASSPIIVAGLTSGTNYTFTVTATNASGTGPASAASNSISPLADPVWQLNSPLTFNSTANYVADASVTDFAMVVFSGGSSGDPGGNPTYVGGDINWQGGSPGGGGAQGFAYSGVSSVPTGGATYLVTVGAAGGNSSVGSLLTSTGGGNAPTKTAGNAQGGTQTTGGNVQVGSGLFTVQNYPYGGAGGGPGQSGFSPYGGNFGGGSATGLGGGGGGGVGGNPFPPSGGGGGGAGYPGRVIIFEKKTV